VQERGTVAALTSGTGSTDPEAPGPGRATPRTRWYVLSVVVAALVVAVDQVTKTWALHHLSTRTIHLVWTLQLNLVFNSGVAFGVGRGSTGVLVLIAVVVLVLLAGVGRTGITAAPQAIAAGLVLGGAIGNMTDRLFRHHAGAVIDFIDFQWWPVFNAADTAITCGAILLILTGFRSPAAAP
jgi:signal peptidase II